MPSFNVMKYDIEAISNKEKCHFKFIKGHSKVMVIHEVKKQSSKLLAHDSRA